MTTQTTLKKARELATACDYLDMAGTGDSLRSLTDQVEALTASQNSCGSGAGCLHKDATIEARTAERDSLRTDISKLDVLLEECKMDWSGDVAQIRSEHKHECDALRADADRFKKALTKISALCNNIIDTQSINLSRHIYPLVADLDEAGFIGSYAAWSAS